MKRTILVLAVLGLIGTACGSTRSDRRASFVMQPMTELAVGTLKLDGSAEAVTQQQASELLPMWEVYKQIESSDTAAQQEIDGLSDQIREAMTEAQRNSITAMKLTGRDVFAALPQGPGAASGPTARSNGNGSTQQGSNRTNGNNFFAGGLPGGPGGAGFGPGGGLPGGSNDNGRSSQNGSTAQSATQRLTQSSRPQVPSAVLNALIAYLKAKAAGTGAG